MAVNESGAGQSQSRNSLMNLRNSLLRLHKIILDSERAVYEREIERIRSSGHFLELVLQDPWFAWLRELSQLIVLIDEALDAPLPPGEADAERLKKQARVLLLPAEEGTGFGRRYFEVLQRDPEVVVAHGEMMRSFASLEKSDSDD
jgi:hypothetical protein